MRSTLLRLGAVCLLATSALHAQVTYDIYPRPGTNPAVVSLPNVPPPSGNPVHGTIRLGAEVAACTAVRKKMNGQWKIYIEIPGGTLVLCQNNTWIGYDPNGIPRMEGVWSAR